MGKLSKPEELSSNLQCSCKKVDMAMGPDNEPRAVGVETGGSLRVADCQTGSQFSERPLFQGRVIDRQGHLTCSSGLYPSACAHSTHKTHT